MAWLPQGAIAGLALASVAALGCDSQSGTPTMPGTNPSGGAATAAAR